MPTQQQLDKLNVEMNRIINQHFPEMAEMFGGGRANYRYWASKNKTNKSRAEDKYFYTVGRVHHKGSERFVSGVYRYNASNKRWKAMMKAGHAKKKDAMARAKKLCDLNK